MVTVTVGDQDLAVPVADVVEVIGDYPVTPVPLSPPEVIGVLNLRGRIVTVLDLHARLVGSAAPPLRSFFIRVTCSCIGRENEK